MNCFFSQILVRFGKNVYICTRNIIVAVMHTVTLSYNQNDTLVSHKLAVLLAIGLFFQQTTDDAEAAKSFL